MDNARAPILDLIYDLVDENLRFMLYLIEPSRGSVEKRLIGLRDLMLKGRVNPIDRSREAGKILALVA